MTGKVRSGLLGNFGWFAGLALVLGLLIGGSLAWLNSEKARTAALSQEIAAKQDALRRNALLAADMTGQRDKEAAIVEWQEMIADESLRIAELSAAASEAGVSLLSLRSLDRELTDDGLVSCSHRLNAVANYRQLAHFFERIYAMDGMAAIDELDVEHRAGTQTDQLEASLLVTWYAPSTSDDLENEETIE